MKPRLLRLLERVIVGRGLTRGTPRWHLYMAVFHWRVMAQIDRQFGRT